MKKTGVNNNGDVAISLGIIGIIVFGFGHIFTLSEGTIGSVIFTGLLCLGSLQIALVGWLIGWLSEIVLTLREKDK